MGELENSSHGLLTTRIPQYPTQHHAGNAKVVEEEEKLKLAIEPFRSVIEILTKLEKEDAKAAAQGARLVSLLRRL
ncbi:uncharacterized protein N7477_009019 [Penicillium maclennaniae]|uniref:uncharacterized protein n=1 Tax=Penicillium maclennaniae TaxID=1343394 RepID=UPI002541F7CB|nr:uncharacterized protein N7477_009019 [Penicillium maclennaniae]KAJ5661403.1 hypothetical protein N7477_009019 [Penicillium maclennaniae]